MENRHHNKDFHYKAWLVSRLFAIIGNMPKFVEKRLTEYPLTIDGIREATTRNGISLLDSPEDFLKSYFSIFKEENQFHAVYESIINDVVRTRDEILSSKSINDLKTVCEKCLGRADFYYWYKVEENLSLK